MTMQAVQQFFGVHLPSLAAFGALGAALDAIATGVPLHPVLAARVQEVFSAAGTPDLLDGVMAEQAAPMLAMIRAIEGLSARMLHAGTRTMCWDIEDPALLDAIGVAAAGHAQMLTAAGVPALDGLAARMSAPGGRFLDVGVGVGGLAIAMARMWPELQIDGVDIHAPALELARQNVAASGLAHRIQVRAQPAETLPDVDAYDLIWVPTPFLQESLLPAVARRSLAALRPGGWAVFSPGPEAREGDLQSAVWRLLPATFGGHSVAATETEQIMHDAGFAHVSTLPLPPGGPVDMVVGQRIG